MALVGLNSKGESSFDMTLEDSISSLSPIRHVRGTAMAAIVADHHHDDGRESHASMDSGSASRLEQLRVELEMEEAAEELAVARTVEK